MKEDLFIKNGIVIPEHELSITTSKAGGPGGQHVNKASTRITVRWNIFTTKALTDKQKELVLQKLQAHVTNEGDIIVHNSSSRSQLQNKKAALQELSQKVRKALYVPKKRMKTHTPKAVKEARLRKKRKRSEIKKKRRVTHDD